MFFSFVTWELRKKIILVAFRPGNLVLFYSKVSSFQYVPQDPTVAPASLQGLYLPLSLPTDLLSALFPIATLTLGLGKLVESMFCLIAVLKDNARHQLLRDLWVSWTGVLLGDDPGQSESTRADTAISQIIETDDSLLPLFCFFITDLLTYLLSSQDDIQTLVQLRERHTEGYRNVQCNVYWTAQDLCALDIELICTESTCIYTR